MTVAPSEILVFWFKETPSQRWFGADPAFDAAIRSRFEALWVQGRDGALEGWANSADGALALVLLFDQFPRNMFRGRGEAFSTDAKAREITLLAIDKGFDLAVPPERRQFFYMPLMHAENLADQDRCIALIRERLGEGHFSNEFARLHRAVIVRFGRFPARNKALGRETTPEETEFLASHPAGF